MRQTIRGGRREQLLRRLAVLPVITDTTSQAIIQDLPQSARKDNVQVVLASMDVHEHALFVMQRALEAMGFSPLVAGSEMNPTEIVKVAHDQAASALVVSTYNGMALEMGALWEFA